MIDLDELRSLEAEATASPWTVHDCGFRGAQDTDLSCGIATEVMSKYPGASGSRPETVIESDNRDECTHPIYTNDAALIVALRNNAKAIFDHIEAQVGQLQQMSQRVERLMSILRDTASPVVFEDWIESIEGAGLWCLQCGVVKAEADKLLFRLDLSEHAESCTYRRGSEEIK